MRSRLTVAALLTLTLLPRPALAAANKEHAQLLAEIRMLQEQQQQLQAMLGNLGDAMKALSSKLDDQSAAMRKAMADQALTLNNVGDTVRVVKEKVDDTAVRVSSVSQEIEALRNAIASSQAAMQPPPTVPGAPGGTDVTAPGAAGTVPPTPSAPPSLSGLSPTRAFDAPMDDYTAGRYGLAVDGFNAFIAAFPKHPRAPEAQFTIGQAFFNQGKYEQARDAYQQVLNAYSQSQSAPDAAFKLGQSYEKLGQVDLAKRAYENAVKTYPETAVSVILAKQALERLNRK